MGRPWLSPACLASWAEIRSPVRTISMASDFPTARVSLWVPPAPAGVEGCWSQLALRPVQAKMPQTCCQQVLGLKVDLWGRGGPHAWHLVSCISTSRVESDSGQVHTAHSSWPQTPPDPSGSGCFQCVLLPNTLRVASPTTLPPTSWRVIYTTVNSGYQGEPRRPPEGHSTVQQTQALPH